MFGELALEKKFLNFVNVICFLVIIFLLKRTWYPIEQTLIPFTQKCYAPTFVEIGRVVLKKIF